MKNQKERDNDVPCKNTSCGDMNRQVLNHCERRAVQTCAGYNPMRNLTDPGLAADPKAAMGVKKDPLNLVPTIALRECSKALANGASKYGEYNWRKGDGIKASVYVAAILRHTTKYIDGEDIDKDSGVEHLAHIMAGCAILLDAKRVGKLIDDRPKVESE